MQEPVTLTLPLPPKEWHPNSRPHHMAKYRTGRRYQDSMILSCRDKRPPRPFAKASIRLRYFVRTAKADDHNDDNLVIWFKAGRDALAATIPSKHGPREALGFVRDDKDITCDGAECTKDANNPRLEVTITPHD